MPCVRSAAGEVTERNIDVGSQGGQLRSRVSRHHVRCSHSVQQLLRSYHVTWREETRSSPEGAE